MMKRFMPSILIGIMLLSACSRKVEEKKYPVVGMEAIADVSVQEDGSSALTLWAKRGFRDKPVIHVSSYPNLGHVPEERIRELAGLIREKSWEEIEKRRDAGHESLFRDANYLTVAQRLGIIKDVYWIVPFGLQLKPEDSEQRIQSLLMSLDPTLRKEDIGKFKKKEECFKGTIRQVSVTMCGPVALPTVAAPLLLDIDTGFFPLYGYEHDVSNLYILKKFYDAMTKKGYAVPFATVSYNMERGSLKPVYRYFGDQIREALLRPEIIKSDKPPELWAHIDMAAYILRKGQDQEAIDFLKEPMKQFPGNRDLSLIRMNAQLNQGKIDEVLAKAENLCRGERSRCYFLLFLGKVLAEKDQSDNADKFYRAVLRHHKDWAYANEIYGNFLLEAGKADESIPHFEMVSQKRDDVAIRLKLGYAFVKKGSPAESLSHFETALKWYSEDAGFVVAAAERPLIAKALDAMVGAFKSAGLSENAVKAESIRPRWAMAVEKKPTQRFMPGPGASR